MIKNFNVESMYKKMILDSKRLVLNPKTGKFMVLKESVSRKPKQVEIKTRVLVKKGGFENDKR